jgi:NDP-sugar pyrophosphorylase family protein
MMKSLLIIGAGSFASEVEEMARLIGYSDIAFLDDHPDRARCSPVVGGMDDIVTMKDRFPEAVVSLGNNEARMKYHSILKNTGFTVPVLIHPTAYVSPDAVLSPGCIVRAKAVVSRYARLGEACIINVGGMIDHDCVLGIAAIF